MAQLFLNNASAILANAISTTDTALTLASGLGGRFPAPTGGNYFVLTLYQMSGSIEINHEIVRCTSRAGDVLTVVRAQEGTAARAFSSGDPVSMRLTAGSMTPAAIGAMDATASLGALTLLAALTPTAAASINALTLFSNAHDNYYVVGNGVASAADDTLRMRFATGGVIDSGGNYITEIVDGTSKTTTESSIFLLYGGPPSTASSFSLTIFNANDTRAKSIEHNSMSNRVGLNLFSNRGHVYTSANPLSGFSLFWAGGGNFSASGSIRVYGLQK